jgi:long-chain acyl-CoA synthetase
VFNLAIVLRESALVAPEKVAVLSDVGRLTYAELDARSDSVAAALADRGIGAGDPIGLQLPNVPEFLVAYFGILKAGAVVVPMNPLLKAPEIAFHLGDCAARGIFTFGAFAAEAVTGATEAGAKEIFVVGDAPAGTTAFADLLTPQPPLRPLAGREPQDTAAIVYTSGTTGRPKGAELTHFQLYMNADIPGRQFKIRQADVILAVLPLFHVFGLSSILNLGMRFGCSLSLVPRFSEQAVLSAIERDRATVFDGVPTMFVALLNYPELHRYDISSLRVAVSGGAPIPAHVLDGYEQRYGIVILEGYGLTETAATTTFNPSPDGRRMYSVGKAVWGAEVQIWDADGRQLPPGKDNVGELVTRGYHVTKGYHRQPEATAEAFAGGWFHTGDLGYVDEDGFFFIVDRKKDMIIRGGYNVYPREVEEVLYTHDAVAEAAVVGIPDERLGEEVKAVLVCKPGAAPDAQEIIAFCKARVAAYKYPRVVEFVDALPKNETGKILKRLLAAPVPPR